MNDTPRHRLFRFRREEMCRMRREGMTLEEIGKLFGVSRERVRQITANANALVEHRCPACNHTWRNRHAKSNCPACGRCRVCGGKLTKEQRYTGYHVHCHPSWQPKTNARFTRTEHPGVFVRRYRDGRIAGTKSYGVLDRKGGKWHLFPTVEEALEKRKEMFGISENRDLRRKEVRKR